MFHFRKKTKSLPITIVRKPRSGFSKKASSQEIPVTKRGQTDSKASLGFYGAYIFLWMIFLGVAVYAIVFSPFLRMETIRVDGAVDVSVSDIEQMIREDVAGKYFSIIPQDTMLMIAKSRIEMDLKNRFKKIRSAEVTRVFSHTLVVHIEERKTLVVWCSADQCFYIDEDGYAYAPVDTSTQTLYRGGVLTITDESAQAVDADTPVLDPDFVRFTADIQEKLHQQLGIEVSAEGSTPSRFSDELNVKTTEGWTLFFNVRVPIENSLHTLQLLLKKEISDERRHRLKYIDMRIENRAYYSVEGETVSAPPDPSIAPLGQVPNVAPAVDVNPVKKERNK